MLAFTLPAIAENRTGKDLAANISGAEQSEIGMYRFYSTSAVFYSNKLAVKLDEEEAVSVPRAKTLDWSRKYTMPSQYLLDFLGSGSDTHLVVVQAKQKEEFLRDIAAFDYQLLASSNGLLYYKIE